MNARPRRFLAGAVALAALALVAATPPLPDLPAPVRSVLYARTFTLEAGFRSDWSAEHPEVREGTILVLEADPALLRPRETAEPVLYAGPYVAQRISRAHESGRVVVFVPGRVDLAVEPVWFGTPGLPEQADAATVRSERALADAARIRPLDARSVNVVVARGGDSARFASKLELLQAMDALVREYSIN
jgi:hypothetical protein